MATLAELQANLKDNQTLVDMKKVQIDIDAENNPIYQYEYINNPYTNYKLVDLAELDLVAVLEDLSPQA